MQDDPRVQELESQVSKLSQQLEGMSQEREHVKGVADRFQGMEDRMKSLLQLSEILSIRYNPFLEDAEADLYDNRDPARLLPGRSGPRTETAARDRSRSDTVPFGEAGSSTRPREDDIRGDAPAPRWPTPEALPGAEVVRDEPLQAGPVPPPAPAPPAPEPLPGAEVVPEDPAQAPPRRDRGPAVPEPPDEAGRIAVAEAVTGAQQAALVDAVKEAQRPSAAPPGDAGHGRAAPTEAPADAASGTGYGGAPGATRTQPEPAAPPTDGGTSGGTADGPAGSASSEQRPEAAPGAATRPPRPARHPVPTPAPMGQAIDNRRAYYVLAWFERLAADGDPSEIHLFIDHYGRMGWIPADRLHWMRAMAEGIAPHRDDLHWDDLRLTAPELARLHRDNLRFLERLFRNRMPEDDPATWDQQADAILGGD